jgi:hypothetical protein
VTRTCPSPAPTIAELAGASYEGGKLMGYPDQEKLSETATTGGSNASLRQGTPASVAMHLYFEARLDGKLRDANSILKIGMTCKGYATSY